MDTLQERLGVAVESDAVRFSGAEFAAGRGASVVGRVRRRRAARAAGYGGASVLAVGALAVGGARLPWGGFVGLDVGAADCVTVGASMGTDAAPVGADVVYSAVVEVEYGTATVRVPGRATAEDPEALTVAPRYIISYTIDGSVEVEAADGSRQVGDLTPDSPLHFTGADGRDVSVQLSPEGDVLSVRVEAQPGEALPIEASSASTDCITPPPTPTASRSVESDPEPSWGGEIVAAPGAAVSPFQCGFVFPGPVGSTGVITIGEPRWLTAGGAEAAVRSLFGDPDSISLALSGDDVPLLVYSSISTWPGMNHGGEAGPSDPAESDGAMTFDVDGARVYGGFVDGAQFVLEADDTVIATYSREDVAAGGATQFIDSAGDGDGTMYGLNLVDGFTACPNVDPATLADAQPVAVAGTKSVEQETVAGPYYAWRYITRG
jgi:hypothetical protein